MTNPLTLDIPAGVPWIDFTREFDAPVEAVFNAHRDPELVRQWLGPRGYEMQIERWDFTSGGGYRYTHRDGDNVYGFHGTFHTVRENDLAIQTFEFEGAPDEVAIEFMHFVELTADPISYRLARRACAEPAELLQLVGMAEKHF